MNHNPTALTFLLPYSSAPARLCCSNTVSVIYNPKFLSFPLNSRYLKSCLFPWRKEGEGTVTPALAPKAST